MMAVFMDAQSMTNIAGAPSLHTEYKRS